jgi:cell wall-associated NlpC family hydrolase
MSSKYQGIPFRDFQKGPLDGDYGSDCSGLVASCMIEAGILDPKLLNFYGTDNFREDSDMLYHQRAGYLPPQTLDNLEIGDLIFMKGGSPEATDTYPGHMGIYVGNGWMTHCGAQGVQTIPLLQRGDVIELKRMRPREAQ